MPLNEFRPNITVTDDRGLTFFAHRWTESLETPWLADQVRTGRFESKRPLTQAHLPMTEAVSVPVTATGPRPHPAFGVGIEIVELPPAVEEPLPPVVVEEPPVVVESLADVVVPEVIDPPQAAEPAPQSAAEPTRPGRPRPARAAAR